uniref:Glutathione S-transferase 1-1 n=1 Tax=Caligus rogercresseyi TaxID=217165 RepID=C1BMU1_CALRO|nr:Glutathione S-transferase 1-1 [Caligus rogercresseyi]
MGVEIYGLDISAPYRIACMAAEAAGATYETKHVDIFSGDNMKPEFLALNPQHNVPVMKHNDFVMNEGRAIATYLALEFDKTKKLYPTDCNMAHARISQRMYFDMGVFYKAFGECVYPKMFRNAEVPKEAFEELHEVLGWANDMVKETGFAAGTDHMTIADICWVATYSTIKAAGIVPLDKYKELEAWFDKCVSLIPNYEKANGNGAKAFSEFYKSKV